MTTSVCKSLFALLAVVLPCAAAFGEELAHSHAPIVHRSRPVIERLPLKVVDPIDVTVSDFGDTLVADRVGKVVFRIDARGDATLLGKDLDGLSRLTYSKTYGPHILLSDKGSGHIIRVTEAGHQSRTHLPFKPAGIGVDLEGNMLTANSVTGQVWKIDAEGNHSVVKHLNEPALDLVVDSFGTVIVLLRSGKLVAVFPASGTAQTEGYLPPTTTRIAIDPRSRIIGLAPDADGNPVLLRPGTDRGDHERFARTSQGTAAFAFDRLGNLTMASPYFRAVTRVTSHFQIPCPHCGQKVDMLFSPDAPLPEDNALRSF